MKILAFLTAVIFPVLMQGDKTFVPCRDEAVFRKQYLETSRRINTLKASFVQEKSISLLTEKLISYGEFLYKKEAMIRMEYDKPVSWLFVMNRDKVYIRSQNKDMNIPAGSSKLFSQISSITIGVVNGDILTGRNFAVTILENKTQYLLKLVPRAREIKLLFSEFEVLISKKDYMAEAITMFEISGDKTTITFTDKQVNTPLSDALFSVR